MTTAAAPTSPQSLHEGWGGARAVLHGPLRKLVTGQAIGQGADGLAQIAFASVVLFDIGKGATAGRVAAVLAVTLLPFSIVGPFAGVVIDRWDRRRVLVLVSVARAVIAVGAIAVVLLQSELLAYIGILLLLSSSRFVLAAKGAALPTTVAAEQLVTANAVSSVAGMVTAFGGAVIGATFVGAAPSAGFVVAGALYALAAVVFTRLPPVGGGDTGITLAAGLRRTRAELAGGVRVIVNDREIRDPLLAVWLHRFLLGAGFILLVLIADRRYHFHTSGYALALAVTGIAAFAGTLAAPVLARSHRARALLPAAFPAAAIAALLGGYWPNLPVLVLGLGIAAFAFQVLKTLVDALVGGAATDQVRGRVFAAYDVLYNVAFVLAGLALIPLWQLGRERAVMWWLAAAFVAAGLLVASWTKAWPFAQTRTLRDRARPRNGWRMRAATCVVAALPVLAFPAPSWWWLAWCGLVPFLLLVRSAPTLREAGLRAWWGGGGFMLAMHHWLIPNIGPFVLLASAGIGALWLPWGWLVWESLGRDRRRLHLASLLLVPSGWVCIEAARSWASLGGPWGLLGASQWNVRPILAAAALGGVWLVSFLIVTVNVALVIAITATTRARVRLVAITTVCGAFAVGPLWYALQPAPRAQRDLRAAIVQPGVVSGSSPHVDEGEKLSESLTKSLARSRVDLVVWGREQLRLRPRATTGPAATARNAFARRRCRRHDQRRHTQRGERWHPQNNSADHARRHRGNLREDASRAVRRIHPVPLCARLARPFHRSRQAEPVAGPSPRGVPRRQPAYRTAHLLRVRLPRHEPQPREPGQRSHRGAVGDVDIPGQLGPGSAREPRRSPGSRDREAGSAGGAHGRFRGVRHARTSPRHPHHR